MNWIKISTDTPIAQALMGKKPGDVVQFLVPKGEMRFEVLRVGQ